MSFIPGFPEDATLRNAFGFNVEAAGALLEYHEILLRGDSPFSIAERELIAGYVSGLNQCGYCHGIHTAVAEAFGISEGLMVELIADVDASSAPERMKPVLNYVHKLTETPSRMTEADAKAVYDAGWDARALHDAVSVCALFNFMNRFVDGHGLKGSQSLSADAGERLHDGGYLSVRDLIQPVP